MIKRSMTRALSALLDISRASVGGVKTSPPEVYNVSGEKKCGNCEFWGDPDERGALRPCRYPVPKHLSSGWMTLGSNAQPCPTWKSRR